MKPLAPSLLSLTLALALLAGGAGGAGAEEAPVTFIESGPFSATLGVHNQVPPKNKKRTFEDSARLGHLQVERVVEAMALQPGQRVLDFGAGSGVFTFPMARKVGPKGTVVATEIQPGLLTMLADDAKQQGLPWVTPVQGQVADPAAPLRGRTFDVALLSSVYEFLPDPEAFLKDLLAALAPGGRVIVIHPKMIWGFNLYNAPDASALVNLAQQTRFQHPLIRRLSPRTLDRLRSDQWANDLPALQLMLAQDLNRILEDPSLFLDAKGFHAAAKRDKDAIFRILLPHQGRLLALLLALHPDLFLEPGHKVVPPEDQVVLTVNWLLVRSLIRGGDAEGGGGFGRSFLADPKEISETMTRAGFSSATSYDFLAAYDFLVFTKK